MNAISAVSELHCPLLATNCLHAALLSYISYMCIVHTWLSCSALAKLLYAGPG